MHTEKTNAMRALDRAGVKYGSLSYLPEGKEISPEDAPSGVEAAVMMGLPPERVFKTLVTQGKSLAHYVFVIPVARELDLKKAARAVGEKSVEMIKSKELFPLTGYVHGGCSPLGMKKQFVTVLDESARGQERIVFSAGKIGRQIEVSPADLAKALKFAFADLTAERK
ncbi:MAG TPA: Cys-tRNA(Pro) deacylase [Candidatus Limadaptatus stercorigallinarum]|uniref:Cys-tRNA(Pro)/Cys-tRNA(Cys) deacylase n=1 Tax=Candidatus Limadaptatus stercorigallinarum TaxID=2840845 RepID=A0A9D1HRB9_9FIRM|nr:Cys-tRNA(Pro) deacylase [Candidatus Limadaptatus stercorigallinarum]